MDGRNKWQSLFVFLCMWVGWEREIRNASPKKLRLSILGSPSMGNITGSAAGRRKYRCFTRAVDRKPLSRHPFQCRGDGAGGREYLFLIWSPRSITPFIEKGARQSAATSGKVISTRAQTRADPLIIPIDGLAKTH